jgi:hypothetical protein
VTERSFDIAVSQSHRELQRKSDLSKFDTYAAQSDVSHSLATYSLHIKELTGGSLCQCEVNDFERPIPNSGLNRKSIQTSNRTIFSATRSATKCLDANSLYSRTLAKPLTTMQFQASAESMLRAVVRCLGLVTGERHAIATNVPRYYRFLSLHQMTPVFLKFRADSTRRHSHMHLCYG